MKLFCLFLCLTFISCSVTQFSSVQITENDPLWNINIKRNKFNGEFTLSINNTIVTRGKFKMFNNEFVSEGTYDGKKVKLLGSYISSTSMGVNGSAWVRTSYKITIMVNDNEAAVFHFF